MKAKTTINYQREIKFVQQVHLLDDKYMKNYLPPPNELTYFHGNPCLSFAA